MHMLTLLLQQVKKLVVTQLRRLYVSFDHIEELGRKTTLTEEFWQFSRFDEILVDGICHPFGGISFQKVTELGELDVGAF